MKKYYEANKEKTNLYAKTYYEANKEKKKIYNKEWYQRKKLEKLEKLNITETI